MRLISRAIGERLLLRITARLQMISVMRVTGRGWDQAAVVTAVQPVVPLVLTYRRVLVLLPSVRM